MGVGLEDRSVKRKRKLARKPDSPSSPPSPSLHSNPDSPICITDDGPDEPVVIRPECELCLSQCAKCAFCYRMCTQHVCSRCGKDVHNFSCSRSSETEFKVLHTCFECLVNDGELLDIPTLRHQAIIDGRKTEATTRQHRADDTAAAALRAALRAAARAAAELAGIKNGKTGRDSS